jgi:hypothetical protein
MHPFGIAALWMGQRGGVLPQESLMFGLAHVWHAGSPVQKSGEIGQSWKPQRVVYSLKVQDF